MKNRIERTLFWFRDGDNKLNELGNSFFGLSNLLNRLLNESYSGRKIQFININFFSEETYKNFPQDSKNFTHYSDASGGYLEYYGIIDFKRFNRLSRFDQFQFIWKQACEWISESANTIKNSNLFEACECAYKKGTECNIDPNFRVVETNAIVYGRVLKASVWINFREDGMYSNLTLEENGKIIFERNIDKSRNGVEFFLEIYKSIEIKNNTIIIKGNREVEYLPLEVKFDENIVIS